jgi:hypothetical protein
MGARVVLLAIPAATTAAAVVAVDLLFMHLLLVALLSVYTQASNIRELEGLSAKSSKAASGFYEIRQPADLHLVNTHTHTYRLWRKRFSVR